MTADVFVVLPQQKHYDDLGRTGSTGMECCHMCHSVCRKQVGQFLVCFSFAKYNIRQHNTTEMIKALTCLF